MDELSVLDGPRARPTRSSTRSRRRSARSSRPSRPTSGTRVVWVPLPSARCTRSSTASPGSSGCSGLPAEALDYFASPTTYATDHTTRDLTASGLTCRASTSSPHRLLDLMERAPRVRRRCDDMSQQEGRVGAGQGGRRRRGHRSWSWRSASGPAPGTTFDVDFLGRSFRLTAARHRRRPAHRRTLVRHWSPPRGRGAVNGSGRAVAGGAVRRRGRRPVSRAARRGPGGPLPTARLREMLQDGRCAGSSSESGLLHQRADVVSGDHARAVRC